MNALKHGKYASRPDPVKLLLEAGYGSDYGSGYGNDQGEGGVGAALVAAHGRGSTRQADEAAAADEAERASLRAEMVRCYAPRDDFARLQAEELADLKFELLRLERVKEVMWRRERELLEIEQRRRHWLTEGGVGMAGNELDLSQHGYASLPDSPAKFLGMRSMLVYIVRQAGEETFNAKAVHRSLNYLYGAEKQSFCGKRLRDAEAAASALADNPQAAQQAKDALKAAAESQLDRVEEQLGICLMEEGPLSETGQAARLLEATSSRKWGWVRSQENFLRRSIDRQVKVLIELRYEDTREALAATRKPKPPDAAPGAPDATRNEPAPPPVSAAPPVLPEGGMGPASGPAAAEPASALQGGGEAPDPVVPASDQVSASIAKPERDKKVSKSRNEPTMSFRIKKSVSVSSLKCGNPAPKPVHSRELRVEGPQLRADGRREVSAPDCELSTTVSRRSSKLLRLASICHTLRWGRLPRARTSTAVCLKRLSKAKGW